MQLRQTQRLSSLVHDCLSKHLYASAIFYADKLVTLSEGAPADVFTLAQVCGPRTDQNWVKCRTFIYMRAFTVKNTVQRWK